MRQTTKLAVLGLVGAIVLLNSGGGWHSVAVAQEKASLTVVKIDNFSFAPMELTITAGSTVTWINKDDVPHTVLSVDHGFQSQALDTDQEFSFTFSDIGTYEYFCSVHPKMTGKIVVK